MTLDIDAIEARAQTTCRELPDRCMATATDVLALVAEVRHLRERVAFLAFLEDKRGRQIADAEAALAEEAEDCAKAEKERDRARAALTWIEQNCREARCAPVPSDHRIVMGPPIGGVALVARALSEASS